MVPRWSPDGWRTGNYLGLRPQAAPRSWACNIGKSKVVPEDDEAAVSTTTG